MKKSKKRFLLSAISCLLLTNVAFGGMMGGNNNDDSSSDENCTYNVQKDKNYTTITKAIDDADNGNTILMYCEKDYDEDVKFGENNDSITLEGNTSNIDDTNNSKTITIDGSNIILKHFKIQGKITVSDKADGNLTFYKIHSDTGGRGFEIDGGDDVNITDCNLSEKNEAIYFESDYEGNATITDTNVSSSDAAAFYFDNGHNFSFKNLNLNSKGSSFYMNSGNLEDFNISDVNAIGGNDVVAVAEDADNLNIRVINCDMNSTDKDTWNVSNDVNSIYIENSKIYTDNSNDNHDIYMEGTAHKDITILDSNLRGQKSAFWYKGGECNISVKNTEFTAKDGYSFHGETEIDHLDLENNVFNEATDGNVIFNQNTVHNVKLIGNEFHSPGDGKEDVDIKAEGNPITANNNCFYDDKYFKIDEDGDNNNFDGNYWDGVSDGDKNNIIDKDDSDKIGDYIKDHDFKCGCKRRCPSKYWAGVGKDDGKNKAEKNAVDMNMKLLPEDAEHKKYHRMTW